MNPTAIAQACADDPADLDQYWPLVLAGLDRWHLDDHWTRIAAAATGAVECDWHWLTELGDPSYLEGRTDLGNTQPGDGARFRGRGFIQLTGRNEYTEFSQVCGIDLVASPERAAEPAIAGLSLAWYFSTHGVQGLANNQQWYEVRRVVNGGYTGIDRFLACVANLGLLPDDPPLPAITRVAVEGVLHTKPTDTSSAAIDANRKPVWLTIGTRVLFTPDPHLHIEVTPHWCHVSLPGSPVHGWILRTSVETTGG